MSRPLPRRGSTATTVDKAEPDGDAPAPIEPVDRHADARSCGDVHAEGRRAADRHQRIRRLRRPDRRERRARAEPRFVLREGIRLQGQDLDERERDLVAAQQRPPRGHRDDDRCARGARPAVRSSRAGADRLLARRRHGRRRSRHRLGEPARRQGARRFAVQRERVLHPLPRAGSRRAGRRAARPRLATGAERARPGVLRRCVRRLRCLRARARRARSRA